MIKTKGHTFRLKSSEILLNRKKENSLLNALISPNDNLIYSLYFYPRQESKLLIRKWKKIKFSLKCIYIAYNISRSFIYFNL